jgi:hypothetical protein
VSRHERSAYAGVEKRSDRAVGCSRCWAGRPRWQLLGRHTSAQRLLPCKHTDGHGDMIAVARRAASGEAPSRATAEHTRREWRTHGGWQESHGGPTSADGVRGCVMSTVAPERCTKRCALRSRTGAADRESRQPNGEAQPAARRVVTWRARRQSAHDVVENRPDRAVGCSECWAGRPGWQLLSRHTLAAMPLAVPSTRPSTARISRAEPCKQRRSAKTSEGEAYAACVRCIRWLAGVRRRADERR